MWVCALLFPLAVGVCILYSDDCVNILEEMLEDAVMTYVMFYPGIFLED
jgi:hypothetical protein